MLKIKLVLSFLVFIAISACTSKKVDKESGELADLSEDAFVLEGDADPFALDESVETGDDLVADLGSDSANMDDFSFDDLDSSSSSSASSEAPVEGADPFADSGTGEADPFADSGAGGDDFGDDAFADNAGGDFGSDPFAEAPASDMAGGGATDASEPLFSEPSQDSFVDSTPSSEDSLGPIEEPFQPASPMIEEEAERSWVPVKKIAELPFRKSGALINAVYLAREGDTLAGVSEKVFGSAARSEELLEINPHFRGKDLKVGDKVYYSSPSRPTDEQNLLTYYEDIGLSPEFYMTQSGDNIRQVASRLLGHPDSWKEVWATNFGVESKGDLDAGLQIKYWSSETASSAPMAQATPPPAPPSEPDFGSPPPANGAAVASNDFGNFGDEDMGSEPPPPPPSEPDPSTDLAQSSDFAPPAEPPPAAGFGSVEPPPPPPPPPPAMAPPPPERSAAKASVDDSEQTLMMGMGALLLLAAVAVFIVRRKRAQKQLDFNTATQTQIE